MAYINGTQVLSVEFLGGTGIVDQDYNPESENAQSGKAVAQAVSIIEYYNQETKGFWKSGFIRPAGTIKENHASYNYTELLPINEYTVVEIDILGRGNGSISSVAYYKDDKTFLSNQMGDRITSIDIPEGAYYIAFTLVVDEPTANNVLNIKRIYSKISDIAKMAENNEKAIADIEPRLSAAEQSLQEHLKLKTDGGYTRIFRTIGVIGDSLSSGEMTYKKDGKNTNEDMYEYSWLQYMARNCGSTGFNFSQGGLSTKTFLLDEGGKATDCYTIADHKCQAYFIALGHNDHNQSIPTGTSEDIGTNADTFYRYYAEIIQKLQDEKVAPKAKIFVITMKNNYNMQSYAEYNTAIRYMATIFDNVYVLDMNEYFPDRPDEHITNGHANAMGYYQYSLEIQTLVDKVIRENLDEFMYVQFINNTELEKYIPN